MGIIPAMRLYFLTVLTLFLVLGLQMDYIDEQIRRQTETPDYTGQLALDYAPFEPHFLPAERLSAIETLLDGATIPDIQAHYAAGRLTAEELVLFYVQNIRAREDLNAVIRLNPDALALAREADPTADGLLYGIPILLKDNIGTGDQMPTAAGAKALANATADRDALIVQQLREAGAIILGKTNLSEWANFMTRESANGFSVLGGQTRSPYGRFDVGGSSSGSAVAVAANLVTASIGTETSGSLVYPASQNGVVTLKPTLGLLSQDRIIPITAAQDTAGPMTRSVTDLALLMQVFVADFDPQLETGALQGRRVGIIRRTPREGDAEILDQAVQVLQSAGATTVDVTLPQIEINMLPVLAYGMRVGVDEYLQATDAPVETLAAVIAFNAEDPANRAPFGQDLLEMARDIPLTEEQYTLLVARNRAMTQAALHQTMQIYEVDMLVSLSNYATLYYAPAGFPALNVPAGRRPGGEPLGITLIGLDDVMLVEAAYAFEQARG